MRKLIFRPYSILISVRYEQFRLAFVRTQLGQATVRQPKFGTTLFKRCGFEPAHGGTFLSQ